MPGHTVSESWCAKAHPTNRLTGDAKLVEHTENDDYWGDGGDGSGRNMLGQLLMKVRRKLRSE